MRARLSRARPLPGHVRDGRLHRGILLGAALRGVMIGAELGRVTSRFGESRVPKYGRTC